MTIVVKIRFLSFFIGVSRIGENIIIVAVIRCRIFVFLVSGLMLNT
jgi:hypothetical protein